LDREQLKVPNGRLTIVAPTKRHYQDSRLLTDLTKLGSPETPRTLGRFLSIRPVVISFWPTASDLELLDGASGLMALAVVPWNESDIAVWRDARGAEDLLGKIATPDSALKIDPIVRAALETINLFCNVATGVKNPRDRATAIHVFRTLRDHGNYASPEVTKRWAMSNGWSAGDARELSELAEGVNSGKAYRVARYMLNENLYESWAEEASRND
jgi:hypothetical protein